MESKLGFVKRKDSYELIENPSSSSSPSSPTSSSLPHVIQDKSSPTELKSKQMVQDTFTKLQKTFLINIAFLVLVRSLFALSVYRI